MGTGSVGTSYTDDEIELNERIAPSFDAQEEAAPNCPTRRTDDNRAYWEANAARGGHTLSELLADTI
ncbi:hypothetical protein [Rhodococcus sp. P1Y]|uniref:hypothetical protein n=1 Tax=Rhodococcus sp. P1Y TaxID=1302308 RepID=UPI000EAF4E54|nr:hypothetical protein [Rhodococcus sp. P1Y]AYJ49013.1 hypothetical protein D8W71_12455 [Rhodococcus sp. P1Y]